MRNRQGRFCCWFALRHNEASVGQATEDRTVAAAHSAATGLQQPEPGPRPLRRSQLDLFEPSASLSRLCLPLRVSSSAIPVETW